MASTEYPAVKDLGRGVVALTALGRRPRIPAERLQRDAARIEHGSATVIVYTPGGDGRTVLAAPTETILLRADDVERLGAELLIDVGGGLRFEDPLTALFDAQWRLSLMGRHVIAEDGLELAGWNLQDTVARAARIRGMLTMLDTNLGMPLRGRLLALAQLLAVSVPLAESATDTTVLDLQRSPGGDGVGDISVPAAGLVGAYAIDASLDDLGDAIGVRRYVQDTRRVPDRALLPLIRRALPDVLTATGADDGLLGRMTGLLGLDDTLDEAMHVLFIAPESEPGRTRCAEAASHLHGRADVRITSVPSEVTTDGTEVVQGWIHEQTAWADVIVLVATMLDDAPGAWFSGMPLVADLSSLDIAAWLMTGPRTKYRAQALDELMRRADLILAADAVQRDILLGALAGTERVNAAVYDDDPSLNSLVTVDADGDLLTSFCLHPVRAADVAEDETAARPPKPNDMVLALRYLREGGVRNVAGKAVGRLRRQRREAHETGSEA